MARLNLKKSIQSQTNDLRDKATERSKGFSEISISEISVKENPRKTFDTSTIQELAKSLEKHGQLQPILVDSDKNLVAGERRLRAAKLLNWSSIKATVYNGDSDPELVSIIENIQREDLNLLELGESVFALKANFDMTQTEIAKQLNKSKSWISEVLSTYKKIKENPELLEKFGAPNSGKVSTGAIKKLRNNNQSKISINYRWTLSEKVKTKMNSSEYSKVESLVKQMEEIKGKLDKIVTKVKERKT